MPWPLWDAGGRLVPGERGSWPVATCWGEKYDAEVADEAVKEGAVGVEGLDARRDRDETEGAVEVVDGRRNKVGGSGAVLVRWCFDDADLDDDLRDVCWEKKPERDDLRE